MAEVCKYPPRAGEGTRIGTRLQHQAARIDQGLLLAPGMVAASPCPAETVLGRGSLYPKDPPSRTGEHRGLSEKPFQCRRGLAGQAHGALEVASAHQTEGKGAFILFLITFLSREDPLHSWGQSDSTDSYLCSAAPLPAVPGLSVPLFQPHLCPLPKAWQWWGVSTTTEELSCLQSI